MEKSTAKFEKSPAEKTIGFLSVLVVLVFLSFW